MCETERQAEMGLIEFLKFTEQDDCDKYNMLQQSACEIRDLENKNQLLEKRIKKALDFIDSKVISNGEVIDRLRKIEVKELIEILNGKSDE